MRFLLILAAGTACSVAAASSGDNKIVNGTVAPSNEYKWDAIARFGPKSLQSTPGINPSPTCFMISPKHVLLPNDSVYNTSNQLYANYGGTPQSYFGRFRRMSNGTTFADDGAGTPLIYDADIDVLGRLPMMTNLGVYILGVLDPADVSHITPLRCEFSRFPVATEDAYRAGYGRTTCPGSSPTRYLNYFSWPISEDLTASPDMWSSIPIYEPVGVSCSYNPLSLPHVNGGDSGSPTMYEDGGGDFVALQGYGAFFGAIHADSQRVLMEFSGETIDTGSFSMSPGAAFSFAATHELQGCLYPIDSTGFRCNSVACGVGDSGTVTTSSGVFTYSGSDASSNHIVTKSGAASPCANATSYSETQILGAMKVSGHDDYLKISIGTQQTAEASLSFASGTPGTLAEPAQATGLVGSTSSRIYGRVPFEVNSSGYMWVKLRMQGLRDEIGGAITQPGSRGYWIIRHDLDGDGVVESGDRVARISSSMDGMNYTRPSSNSAYDVADGEGARDLSMDHAFLADGHYVLEVGIYNSAKAEVTTSTCGTSGSDSIYVEDSFTVIMEPEAPCGSIDYNLDGVIDYDDYYTFVDVWTVGDIDAYPSPDFNRDGFVDFFDYDLYYDVFADGKACDESLPPSFVSVFP